MNEDDEYDADIQVVMNPNANWEPKDYLDALYDTLDRSPAHSSIIKLRTRCVTVDFPGDFHLDLVPRITHNREHHICNKETNEPEITDGTGYRNWFSEKSRITKVNLKRAVRLLKWIRDRDDNYVTRSILLTTLAGNTIHPSDRGTEAVRTVGDTLTTVLTRMDEYLQRHPSMPRIINPALPTEDFNRHWDQSRYEHFRDRINVHAGIARNARAQPNIERAIMTWRRLFRNEFGKHWLAQR